MFGVCPEVNSKISYAGTAAYMFHVKQLPGISQSFLLLDAGRSRSGPEVLFFGVGIINEYQMFHMKPIIGIDAWF